MTINQVDIEVDDDGDLVLDSNGDLKLASAQRTALQDIIMRVRTGLNDLSIHPLFGADIVNLVGEPNTPETAEKIKARVYKSLVRDGRFGSSTVRVDVVPVGRSEVVVLIGVTDSISDVDADTTAVTLSFLLNYDAGDMTILR